MSCNNSRPGNNPLINSYHQYIHPHQSIPSTHKEETIHTTQNHQVQEVTQRSKKTKWLKIQNSHSQKTSQEIGLMQEDGSLRWDLISIRPKVRCTRRQDEAE